MNTITDLLFTLALIYVIVAAATFFILAASVMKVCRTVKLDSEQWHAIASRSSNFFPTWVSFQKEVTQNTESTFTAVLNILCVLFILHLVLRVVWG